MRSFGCDKRTWELEPRSAHPRNEKRQALRNRIAVRAPAQGCCGPWTATIDGRRALSGSGRC